MINTAKLKTSARHVNSGGTRRHPRYSDLADPFPAPLNQNEKQNHKYDPCHDPN
jgi:hypothetical protein